MKTKPEDIIHVFTGEDHKEQFEKAVDWLIGKDIQDRRQRMAAVKQLADQYIAQVGERPDPAQLERLTDYILREELADKNPHKVRHAEYPIFSDRQLMLREGREAPIKAAATVATDGRDYRKPVRRKRSDYENRFVDEKAKSRNKYRRQTYKRNTSPGPVVTYNLDELTE
jgi:hypothetical protein